MTEGGEALDRGEGGLGTRKDVVMAIQALLNITLYIPETHPIRKNNPLIQVAN